MEGCPHRWLVGTCEVVPQDGSASLDMEITDGLFHASFVAIRQLYKDLPSLSGHQNHSYSPIWGSDGGLPTQVAIGTCEVVPQDGSPFMDTEITVGLFHASFVAIRQL